MKKFLYVCILCICLHGQTWAVSTGEAPYGFSVTKPFLTEVGLMAALGKATLSNCFMTTIRVDGMDGCTIASWPMFCVRFRNNAPSNILEASEKFQHAAVLTVAGTAMMESAVPQAHPGKKQMGRSSGTHSGSSTAMARTQAMPLLIAAVFGVAQGVSIGNLCNPQVLGVGYLYMAEGDENEDGVSFWRGPISPYWLNGITAPITSLGKVVELSGFCGVDFTHFICYGGYGTVFPGAGVNTNTSPSMNLLLSAWRAQEIHAPIFPTFGVYGVSIGPIAWMLHSPRSYGFGAAAQIPKYSEGSYVQWIYPGTLRTGIPDTYCYPIGIGPGTLLPIATQMSTETLSATAVQNRVLAFGYWPRWTCCNYCQTSNTTIVRQMVPEKSFRPSISRLP